MKKFIINTFEGTATIPTSDKGHWVISKEGILEISDNGLLLAAFKDWSNFRIERE